MTHAQYIMLAFAVTAIGMIGVVLTSFSAMRRSEALADDLRSRD
jgi:heme exporter protein D